MTRCAIYARYSTDLQDPTSIADQVREAREYAARKGWEVVAEFTDPEISGETLFRPGIQALIAAAAERRFEVVLAETLNRVSRHGADAAQLRRDLEFYGVTIHRPTRGDVSEIDTYVEGIVNAQQRADLKLQIRRGQRGNIERGRTAGGRRYGYDTPAPTLDANGALVRGRLTINEAEAEIIRRVFAEYVGGVSPIAIAGRLNAERIPAPSGGQWSVSTIVGHRGRGVGILHNRLYVGLLVYNRVRMIKNPRTGKRLSRPNPESEWKVRPAPELRIVDDETWNAAQAAKIARGSADAQPRHRPEAYNRPRHMLAGLARCGICGAAYSGHGDGWLRCAGYSNKRTCRNASRIRRATLETRVLDEIRALLSTPAAIAAAVRELHAERQRLRSTHEATRRSGGREMAEIGGKIERLVAAIENGAGDVAALAARIRALEARRAELTADLAHAAAELKVVDLAPDAHQSYRRQVAALEAALTSEDPVERAQAMAELHGLITEVKITPRQAPPRGDALRSDLQFRDQPSFTIAVSGQIERAFDLAREHPTNKRGGSIGSGGAHQPLTPRFRRIISG